MHGDSGGPLLFNGVVCGVNSKFGLIDEYVVAANMETVDAAVDSPNNRSFLRTNLLVGGDNAQGPGERIKGECLAGEDPSTTLPVFDSSVNSSGTTSCTLTPQDQVTLPFPTASSLCTPGEVTVTGEITKLDGVPVLPPLAIPDAAHGTAVSGYHQYTVIWTATDGNGQSVSTTQVINTPETGPTLVALGPSSGTVLASCTTNGGLQATFPYPATFTGDPTCTATTTGAITTENGQVLATPIPLDSTGSALVAPGPAVITWTSKDGLGFSAQLTQAITIETNGPCFSGAGWQTNGGPAMTGTQPGGGVGTALAVTPTTNWNTIVSPTFSTNGLVVGNYLEFDIYLPSNLFGQAWWGGVQAAISIPSANIYHYNIGGNNDLKGSNLPLGQFSTIKIPLPTGSPNIPSILSSPHSVTVEIDLNSPTLPPPTGPIGPWYFENFRFGN
jgi:hypothetical protein